MTVFIAPPQHEPGCATAARPRIAVVAAGIMLLAAGIHVIVIPEHILHWWPAGAFFLVVAAGQARLSALLLRPLRPSILLSGVWGNLAVVGVYVWSRTTGLPFVPARHHGEAVSLGHAGHVLGGVGNGVPVLPQPPASHAEGVGTLDLVVLAAELAVVALLVSLLPEALRRWTTNAMLACGVALWTLWALRGTGVWS
jgi:hypothetical protein